MLKIHRVTPTAKIPTRATSGAAGYDLYADNVDPILIPSQSRALIPTHLKMVIPCGLYGRIAPRSGLALKNGIDVLAGVIDSDYRNAIGVILYNSDKDKDFTVNFGDRIAQIIFETCHETEFQEVTIEGTVTSRTGGFGSTGVS